MLGLFKRLTLEGEQLSWKEGARADARELLEKCNIYERKCKNYE